MDLCFYLTKGSFGSSVEMVIIGVKRRMEGLLGKRTSDLRSVKYVYEFNTLISFFFFLLIFFWGQIDSKLLKFNFLFLPYYLFIYGGGVYLVV